MSWLWFVVCGWLCGTAALAVEPTASTSPATSINTTSASLNAAGVPGGEQTYGWFRIASTDPGACDDAFGSRIPATSGTDLGSGVASVPYTLGVTGLTTGTTYWFCAITQNPSGTAFGALRSFTTAGPPIVTTQPATGIVYNNATLQGTANPLLSNTTGWFRYFTSDPGTCSDVGGTRAPVSGGTTLGSGSVAASFSSTTGTLLPGTTYWYCAIASNGYGTSYGYVQNITTPGTLPTTSSTTGAFVTGSTAQLTSAANPQGATTSTWFRYDTASPGTCNDTFGTRAPVVGGTTIGSGTSSVAFTENLIGLTQNTTYYACAIAQNAYGTRYGSVGSFVTAGPPTVVTGTSGSTVTDVAATLSGSANPNRSDTVGWFRYSVANPGTCDDSFGTRVPAVGGTAVGAGSSAVNFTQNISGLSGGTTYYVCAIATNAEGTSFGTVQSFVTDSPPSATTTAASSVTASTATLRGSVNPNGASTSAWFRWSTTDPGTCSDTFGAVTPSSSIGSSNTASTTTSGITGLTPATTYYYCVIASSALGTAYGNVMSFTSAAAAPVVTTGTPTGVLSTTGTFTATATPNGAETTVWFRYATTNPTTCNDTFGTRTPASGGVSAGSSLTATPVSQAFTGLTANTTYYVCAVAQNTVSKTYGSPVTFTTAGPPTATTSGVTSLATTSVTLNGASVPNRAETTGWFRYATVSPGMCNDTFGTKVPDPGTSLGAGSTSRSFTYALTGLAQGTTYYYCAIAQSSEGTSYGSVVTFVTKSPPAVVTLAPTTITGTSAYLSATGNPFGTATTARMRLSTTDPGTCDSTAVTSGTALGTGSAPVTFGTTWSGLTPNTQYWTCGAATNSFGTGVGSVTTFTTTADPPSISGMVANNLASTTVRLDASSNPLGAPTTAWFRYSSSYQSSCNDSFGTRAPSSGGALLGSGVTAVAFSQDITGLTPNVTYYWCVIAQNSVGTTYSNVLTFTTPDKPTVSTGSASSVTNVAATLNGTGAARYAATTAWFRYDTVSPGTCNDSFGLRTPSTGGISLGSGGSSSVSFSQTLSGLTPLTTYYYCAIDQNSEGTAYGTVVSFTTPDKPAPTTLAVSAITTSTATFNGVVIPNGAATTAWFRFGSTPTATCDDTFGAATTTTAVAAGYSPVGYTFAATSLSPGTTYYVCAMASNAYGTGRGTPVSFTTPSSAPSVTSSSPTLLTGTSATLNGTANPAGSTATGWFRYATTSPGACNDSFGTRAPASGGTSLGGGTQPVQFSQPITGLLPSTTYYFCAIAQNANGTAYGSVTSFVTPTTPSVTTAAATAVTASAATLNGSGVANRAATTGWFRYDTVAPATCDDTFGTRAPVSGGSSLGSGTTPTSFTQTLSGLTGGTTYYYCAIASNGEGTSFGAVMSFNTLGPPSVTTLAATGVGLNAATLNGSAVPNGAATTAWFRYGTSDPGTCSDTFGTLVGSTSIGSGSASVPLTASLASLPQGTTYWYCAVASSVNGTKYGAVLSFTTTSTGPTVTTGAATAVSGTTATLNGSANPGGFAATGWFRYATSSPGSCNDTFGTRAPASGGTALGAGSTAVPWTQDLTGLLPGTTYYACAIAQNPNGTSFGLLQSFTTPQAPLATTSAVTAVTSASATLNGSGNPRLSAATGWFRYDTTNPGTCDDAFGTRAPATGGTALGAGSAATPFSELVSGLAPSTTYWTCAIVQNAEGTAFGVLQSFTTTGAPTTVTNAATSVTPSGATLQGAAVPNGLSTTGWFRYAPTDPGTCNDTFGTASAAVSLGSGRASVPWSTPVLGLAPATTYYVCAVASNASGLTFGAVQTFVTEPVAPVVGTAAASAIGVTSATLNGFATPNGAATTGWFRMDTTAPASCDDTFGTRVPAAGGTALGAGTTPVEFAQPVTTTAGTTYWYCAIAGNSAGTSFGPVRSFTALEPPSATTLAATPVNPTSATLNGSGMPHGVDATGWYRYGTSDPGSCDDTFGTRVPATGGWPLGASTSVVNFPQALVGLTPGTTYWFCAVVANANGTARGTVRSFTTPLAELEIATLAPASASRTAATLQGSADPNGASTVVWFRYDTSDPGACDDAFGTRVPATGGTDVGAGTSPVTVTEPVTGLSTGTTYYVCAIGQTLGGVRFGAVVPFTTADAPSVATLAPTGLDGTGATLQGSANPNRAETTGWFRWSATNPGTCSDSFGTRTPATGGKALGAGATAVAFSDTISGLTAGSTYWYCAIASNSLGTTVGTPQSFVAPRAPVVTTYAATSVGGQGATLSGGAVPGGSPTTGWFRYGTTNPGTCSDSFGARAPTSGGTALGEGTTEQPFVTTLTQLQPGTTYWYCAVASNAVGTATGAVASFTTDRVPTVVTNAPTSVQATSATLNGAADPAGTDGLGWFRYGTTNPGTCSDAFGTRAPTSGGTALGAVSASVPYSASVSGLTPSTTYYVCALASNVAGTSAGTVQSFTTPGAPTVTTQAATGLGTTTATLHGAADPHLLATTVWFRYDTTAPASCSDGFGTRAPSAGGTPVGAGSGAVDVTQAVSGLSAGTTYWFCAIAQNTEGTRYGAVLSFTTAPIAPSVTTLAATSITSGGATLQATATPNGAATTGWLRYGTTNPGTCDDTFGTRAPGSGGTTLGAGTAPVAYASTVTGLQPSTTYWACAIAANSAGTGFGAPVSFTTSAGPSVTTLAATSPSPTGVTLQGKANPHLSATTGWFRYDTTAPAQCDDTFGTRAPASGGTALGAGAVDVPFSQGVTGLTPGATYWACAVAESAEGKVFGAVVTFTLPAAPVTTTLDTSAVGATTATLEGTAAPRGLDTTGWFRLATTQPAACDDAFGTRVPASGGTPLGTAGVVAFDEDATGLTAGTTYWYCAVATNTAGTSFGQVRSFTTPATPVVTTSDATDLQSGGATLAGTVNPRLAPTTAWFRYATTKPATCDDTFGTRAPSSDGADVGAGDAPVDVSLAVTGLAPATTYWYCAIARSDVGTGFGELRSLTTTTAPTVTTGGVTGLAGTSATVQATARPNGVATIGWFRWSTTRPARCDDAFGTRVPATDGTDLGAGATAVPFSEALTGLQPGTTYHYCALASSAGGTSTGALATFTTPAAPTVRTTSAVATSATTASLAGTANPAGSSATGWFRYDTVDPGTCTDAFGTREPLSGGTALGAGTSPASFSTSLTGLLPGTTYYACAVGSNAVGTAFGDVLVFTTPGTPTVVTDAPTAVASASATLQATVDPNGQATDVWFRFDTTDPGACDDTFGTRAPASGVVAAGSGTEPVPVSSAVTGLAPLSTYYVCAIASNAAGTAYGDVVTFTTPAGPPSVVTEAATDVAADGAVLHGAGTPNGAATLGWFRWDTTDPGDCDDSFGARTPTAHALGDGATAVAFDDTIDGLAPGTTVWFCAVAASDAGVVFGEVETFTTGAVAPEVVTEDATDVGARSATLLGTANPLGSATVGWFRLGTTEPAACDDAYGERLPGTGGLDLGDGAEDVDFDVDAADLEPATTYWFCAAASNDGGAAFGDVLSFTTAAEAPDVRSIGATVEDGAITLSGAADPKGSPTEAWFRYGTDDPGACDDTFGTRAPTSNAISIGSGRVEATFEQALGPLPPGVYHLCAFASNEGGLGVGDVVTFEVPEDEAPATCGCGVGGTSGRAPVALVAVALAALARRRRRG